MARRVFYSFHFGADAWRAAQVRNTGVVEGNRPVSDNDWEAVKRGGDEAIQRWIVQQMEGRSCTVLLIGANTAGRKWIDFEIRRSWEDRKGVVGIYIHNLRDNAGLQTSKGRNPLDDVRLRSGRLLSYHARAYDPPHTDSSNAYNYIAQHLASWVEEAIAIRNSL